MSAADDKKVRQRRIAVADDKKDSNLSKNNTDRRDEISDVVQANLRGTYWLTRIVILRYVTFIYFVAFLVALHQNRALLGVNGLLPINLYLNNIKGHIGDDVYSKFSHVPTLLWLVEESNVDQALDYIAYLGLGLSMVVFVNGGANWFIMTALWILYHSLVGVGQKWYSFGWESQLLETGFLCIFLCPVWTLNPTPKHSPPSTVVLFAFRWLIFRIMLGAGLIKLRGDKCWRDLTCTIYHYETQPVPNPLAYYMHQTPVLMHKLEVVVNHICELPASFLVLLPGVIGRVGGCIQVFFQVMIIISGNLSFLNWLTILPSLACFDDAFYSHIFSHSRNAVKQRVGQIVIESRRAIRKPVGTYMRRAFNVSLGLLLAYLSIPVMQNLLSSNQAMNTSFDSLRIVNTYGAFGSITKTRTEVIIQGTHSPDPYSSGAVWLDYEFKCKPGNITRRPCLISPYHYRLDWLMWFAAFQNYQYNPWLLHLSLKLLSNDPDASTLIDHNPFLDRDPPKFIRAEHYRYTYTRLGSDEAKAGAWWRRTYIGNYMPPVSYSNTRDIAKQFGWKHPGLH